MYNLDGMYVEVTAAIVVDDGDKVVADVLSLLVASGIFLAAWHRCCHVELNLHPTHKYFVKRNVTHRIT